MGHSEAQVSAPGASDFRNLTNGLISLCWPPASAAGGAGPAPYHRILSYRIWKNVFVADDEALLRVSYNDKTVWNGRFLLPRGYLFFFILFLSVSYHLVWLRVVPNTCSKNCWLLEPWRRTLEQVDSGFSFASRKQLHQLTYLLKISYNAYYPLYSTTRIPQNNWEWSEWLSLHMSWQALRSLQNANRWWSVANLIRL